MLLHESSSKCLKFWFSFCIIQVLIWAWSHRNVHGHRWTDLSCGKLVSSFYLGKNSDHQLWILVLATQSNKFCRLVLTFVGLFNRRLRRIKKPKKKLTSETVGNHHSFQSYYHHHHRHPHPTRSVWAGYWVLYCYYLLPYKICIRKNAVKEVGQPFLSLLYYFCL